MIAPMRLWRRMRTEYAWTEAQARLSDGRRCADSAHDHNVVARNIDAQGDELLERLGLLARMVRRAKTLEEAQRFGCILLDLKAEIKRLDDLEDDRRDANDTDVISADEAMADVIGLADAQLRRALGDCRGIDGMDDGGAA